MLGGTHVYANDASGWDELNGYDATSRINRSVAFSDEDVCTNEAESYFARLRRAEMGAHHRTSGFYL